ncbi:MAG: glycosyltransferase [Candidatus Methanomethylicaceae archaeon]
MKESLIYLKKDGKSVGTKCTKNPRVFIGLQEISGYYTELAEGLKELGCEVLFVQNWFHPFQYSASGKKKPEDHLSQKLFLIFKNAYRKLLPDSIRKYIRNFVGKLYTTIHDITYFIFYLPSILRCDIFIFGYGSSFLPKQIDYYILKKIFKKKVIAFLGHGDDSRPRYMSGYIFNKDGSRISIDKILKICKEQRETVQRVEAWSDYILSYPCTSQFFTRRLLNFFLLGIPYEIPKENDPQNPAHTRQGVVKILHAPSHPYAKGTPIIRRVMKKLQEEGYPIVYLEVTNVPNAEVLKALREADFVVDQLYSDTPMARFALEAASFGKVSIVGGYAWELLKSLIPQHLFPPVYLIHPDELEKAVIHLVTDEELRKSLGEKAQKFVQEHWSRKKVAENFLKLIEDQIPEEWFFDPNEILYYNGCGIALEDLKDVLKNIIKNYGESYLFLEHKPTLKRKLIEFALS